MNSDKKNAMKQRTDTNMKENRKLRHLPGNTGLPLIGQTFSYIYDPVGFTQRHFKEYGPVYVSRLFNQFTVTMLSPDANQMVLLDKDQNFSSTRVHNGYFQFKFENQFYYL